MRSTLVILIIVLSLLSTACSYSTEFYVINASEAPIEVSYKFKALSNSPQNLTFSPAVKLASQLEATSKYDLKEVSTDRYKIDQEARTVTVTVLPQEALFIRVVAMKKPVNLLIPLKKSDDEKWRKPRIPRKRAIFSTLWFLAKNS